MIESEGVSLRVHVRVRGDGGGAHPRAMGGGGRGGHRHHAGQWISAGGGSSAQESKLGLGFVGQGWHRQR
jgi:hypothetical protein